MVFNQLLVPFWGCICGIPFEFLEPAKDIALWCFLFGI